jgi:hypothetical protein
MGARATYKDEPGDAIRMTAVGLERDLDAHRVTDQHCPIDERIVEDARNVVGEILDRDSTRVTRRRSPPMSSIMRMETKPFGEVLAQVPPHVAVAPNAVAKEHRRTFAALSPRLVEQRTTVARDGISPCRHGDEAYAISFSSSSPGNSFTDGYFMISFRAIFQAFWTIQDSDRSCRVASSWISFSMSSGK